VFGGLHYDGILIFSGGKHWDGNFEVNFGKAMYESCKAKFILAISSASSLQQRKTTETFVGLAGRRAFRLRIDFYAAVWCLSTRKLCALFCCNKVQYTGLFVCLFALHKYLCKFLVKLRVRYVQSLRSHLTDSTLCFH
jgi:hypothetical protein